MLTMSNFGRKGRLGNQLFQLAALKGLSLKHNHKLLVPKWHYSKYFDLEGCFEEGTMSPIKTVDEPHYHYAELPVEGKGIHDLNGYFQSEKYWQDNIAAIKQMFSFKQGFAESVRQKYAQALAGFKKQKIAISIRRGDYVGNPNYAQLPITWYFTALNKYFPDWYNHNVIIFSDDIPYCKLHFGGFENVHFAENTFNNIDKRLYFKENESAIEQLCLMSLCDHFIIANSTFSWWGAYLGEKKHTVIVRPTEHLDGNLKANNNTKDYYPAHWKEYEGEKIDLKDVTFMIPVSYDHNDRNENLSLNVCMLQRAFETNIIVMEQGTDKFADYNEYKYCEYYKVDYKEFHRTRMLNDMARMSKTPIIVNWDADVFISPLQIWNSIEQIRSGAADMVFPYDGRFARVTRIPYYKELATLLDVGIFGNKHFKGMNFLEDAMSVGGAIIFNKARYWEGGGENENFVSYGPEDVERDVRFRRQNFNILRMPGALYHLDHYRGPNSKSHNKFYKQNHDELDKIYSLGYHQLKDYIKTWPWCKI